jgi:hypothetical protein
MQDPQEAPPDADNQRMAALTEETRVIRPAAVLDERSTLRVLRELERLHVAKGGLWNPTPSLWQRYDLAWDGVGGTRGRSSLIGSIAVMYDSPRRHQITIYKVTVTRVGREQGWTVDSICDDALTWVGLTLARCPRTELAAPPMSDPFKPREPYTATISRPAAT